MGPGGQLVQMYLRADVAVIVPLNSPSFSFRVSAFLASCAGSAVNLAGMLSSLGSAQLPVVGIVIGSPARLTHCCPSYLPSTLEKGKNDVEVQDHLLILLPIESWIFWDPIYFLCFYSAPTSLILGLLPCMYACNGLPLP